MNWLRNTFQNQGVALAHPDHARDHDRVANILNGIRGVGCRFHKPVNAGGRGWMVIVDGTTDILPDTNYSPPKVSDKKVALDSTTEAGYLFPWFGDTGSKADTVFAEKVGDKVRLSVTQTQGRAPGTYQGELEEWNTTDSAWKPTGINPSENDLLYYTSTGWGLLTPNAAGNYALVSEDGVLGWRELGCDT